MARAGARGGAAVLLGLLAWSLFAFAGRDRWAVAVLAGAAIVNAAIYRPRVGRSHRFVDAGLAACLLFAAFQLVPLPPAVRAGLSPASAAFDRATRLAPPAGGIGAWHALTLDTQSGLWALALACACILTFWSARTTFEERGGLRLAARGIVWTGLVLAIVSFAQRAVSPHLFYGIWPVHARTDTPSPLGPFLSRNDLAAWLALALPLAAGYVIARVSSRSGGRSQAPAGVDEIFDARMAGLVCSCCLMAALLLASSSRSGIVGCGIGLMALMALARSRVTAGQFVGLVVGVLAVGAISAAYVSIPLLTARFNDVFAPDLGRGRLAIWRQVWPMARDFWRSGIGVGAFEQGMIVYERRPFELFINQAHDEYLQVIVEGGVPLALLALFTVTSGWREAGRRLREDRTPVGWIRAGAAAGAIAVAVQSIWDTGLRMPANAVLFALLAAMALHRGGARGAARPGPRA